MSKMKVEDLTVLVKRREGGSDGVLLVLPPIPARVKIITAHQQAMGLREVDVPVVGPDGEPTEEMRSELQQVSEPDGDDLVAVAYAALGVCWEQPEIKAPTFRECGRDVVEYGERFQTCLMEQGFLQEGLVAQSAPVLRALQRSVMIAWGLVREEEELFVEAQEE